MSDDSASTHAQGAFFGRRKGHKLRAHQQELMAQLLPRYAIDIRNASSRALSDLFATPVGRVRLEIGFGGGEHLLSEADNEPHTGFIGCEPYINGMGKVLSQLDLKPRPNIRLYEGDAADLIGWAADASLARIDLIHPDPWPKRRHWKRRFVQRTMIDALARVLVPGGEFRFVSDIDDYCAWTLRHFAQSADFMWAAEQADDWRQPWPGFTMTRYGRKAEREGRRAAWLRFRRR